MTPMQAPLFDVELPEPTAMNVYVSSLEDCSVDPRITQDFIDSLQYGIQQPVVLVERADGGYIIADGHRRIGGQQRLFAEGGGDDQHRYATVPALVYPAGTDPHALTLVGNRQRRKNIFAEFNAARELQKQGVDDAAIRRRSGMKHAEFKKLGSLAKLIPELFRLGEEGEIAETVIFEVAKLTQAQQKELLALYHESGRITAASVKFVRQARAVSAARQIPSSMFTDDDFDQETEWVKEVKGALTHALAVTPEEENDVRVRLQHALAVLEDETTT